MNGAALSVLEFHKAQVFCTVGLLVLLGVFDGKMSPEIKRTNLYAVADAELTEWNVERHVWQLSPRLEDGRRVNLRDIKVGKTVEEWRKEDRPTPGKCGWQVVCGCHILRVSFEDVLANSTKSVRHAAEQITAQLEHGRDTWADVPRVAVVAPVPVTYSPPIDDETEEQFWKRWKTTLTAEEKRDLAPLSMFIMSKRSAPLTDSLPTVAARRTKSAYVRLPKRVFVAAVAKRRWSKKMKQAVIGYKYKTLQRPATPTERLYAWRIDKVCRRSAIKCKAADSPTQRKQPCRQQQRPKHTNRRRVSRAR